MEVAEAEAGKRKMPSGKKGGEVFFVYWKFP
jgi:hypothetical protein